MSYTLTTKDEFITSLERELAALRTKHDASVIEHERDVAQLRETIKSGRALAET
jgi:hypothetical protein